MIHFPNPKPKEIFRVPKNIPLKDQKSISKMISGVELNALIAQVNDGSINGSIPPSSFPPTPGSKPYNRELWRIQNGMLEKSLVNFVVEKSRQKKLSTQGKTHIFIKFDTKKSKKYKCKNTNVKKRFFPNFRKF